MLLFEQRRLLVFIKSFCSCLVSSQFSRQKELALKTDQAIPQIPYIPVPPEAGKKPCTKILEECCLDWKLLMWSSFSATERWFGMRSPFRMDWSRVLVPFQSKLLIVTVCTGNRSRHSRRLSSVIAQPLTMAVAWRVTRATSAVNTKGEEVERKDVVAPLAKVNLYPLQFVFEIFLFAKCFTYCTCTEHKQTVVSYLQSLGLGQRCTLSWKED